jgi:hypothetical protein
MLDIAERCFTRIGEELLKKNLTIRSLFSSGIQAVTVDNETVEMITPTLFFDGMAKLGLDEGFSDIDFSCLMKVLTKPMLDNAIII